MLTPVITSEECEYGQLNLETIDEVAPRLIQFTQELIARLRACNLEVKTTPIYLLNSTDHPIEVPCEVNGVSVQMNFDATLPAWADSPRARLQVSFNQGRRHYHYEHGGKDLLPFKLSVRRVLNHFLREIKIEEDKRRIQNEKETKANQAHRNFSDLIEKLGFPATTENPDIIRKGNLKIMCLTQTPTQVIIMLTVPHDKALEISNKYLKT